MGRRPRLTYPILLVLGALDAAGYSIIAPVSPEIAERTDAGPAVIGLLVATFPLAIAAGFALATPLVTRIPARSLLVVSLLITAAGTLGFVVGDDLPAYFLGRFLMGLGAAGLWLGVTFTAFESWPGQEYRCMSHVFAAYSVGGLLGPGIGALDGVRAPFAAFLALVGFGLAAALTLPRTGRSSLRADRGVLRSRALWTASAVVLFVYVAYGVVEGILPLHLATALRQGEIGLLYVGLSSVVAVSSVAAGHLRPRAISAASLALATLGLTLCAATTAVPVWLVALAVAALGLGLGATGSLGVLLEAGEPERIVTAVVAWSQLGVAGYLLGPLTGGLVADTLGFEFLGLVTLAAAVPVVGLLLRRPG